MTDYVHVTLGQSGGSKSSNSLGMRAMQERAFEDRGSKYLLIKSPPASGKSRALMFIGLDKLNKQNIRKVIVAVPERSIGASFKTTDLKTHGFDWDWEVDDRWNLCTPGGDKSKVDAFIKFMECDAPILICTHATLRFAYDKIGAVAFKNCLVAVDEFHHASADVENRLGELVRGLMEDGTSHIVAMTGSYFRGDAIPVLRPGDEEKFTRVTYTYYEQLNGYEHLKTLGIGYHFYRGRYYDALPEILDLSKKTIIHIPHRGSGSATDDKYDEVDRIFDVIGENVEKDEVTGFYNVTTENGHVLKVADLVDPENQSRALDALRNVKNRDDVDMVIALGMAKEGFDWPFCEHALTVGYRGSLTEVIQIIGRATRDSDDKVHAQFTNLIPEPDTDRDYVVDAVNNMLKAISVSLLMEQVLAPNFNFKTVAGTDEIDGQAEVSITPAKGSTEHVTINIKGMAKPPSERAEHIVQNDLNDLFAEVYMDNKVMKAAMSPEEFIPEVINQAFIPEIIERKFPELNEDEAEFIRQNVVAKAAVVGLTNEAGESTKTRDTKFAAMAAKLDVNNLDIDLIDQINPFQSAYEILSRSVDSNVLERIHETIRAKKITMTEAEAVASWPKIKAFTDTHERPPNINAANPIEKRLAEALMFIQNRKRERLAAEQGQRKF